jgi:hypothetical protein
VSGTDWTGAFVTQLGLAGLGDGGFLLGQASVLPWTNLDRITVVFSEPVTLAAGALDLLGVNTPTNALSGAPAVVGNRVTWTFAEHFTADKLKLKLGTVAGSVADAAGNVMLPFELRFDVLPGDVNASGTVDFADVAAARLSTFATTGDAQYDSLRDVNGDGVANIRDLLAVRNTSGTALPSGQPGSPAASAAAVVAAGRNTRPTSDRAMARAVRRGSDRAAMMSVAATDAALVEGDLLSIGSHSRRTSVENLTHVLTVAGSGRRVGRN